MGRMRHWRAFVFVLPFVGSFLLAGCGGEGAAGGTATPVVSAPDLVVSATAEPPVPSFDPGPFTLPTASPEMARDDRVGAEAAVRYFVDLLNYTYTNRDEDPLLVACAPDSVYCEAVADVIRELQANDHTRRGNALRILGVEAYEVNSGVHYVTARISSGYGEEWASDGARIGQTPGSTGVVIFAVRLEEQGWMIVEAGEK